MALLATRDLSAVQAVLGHSDIRETQGYAKTVALIAGDTAEKTASLIGFNLEEPMPPPPEKTVTNVLPFLKKCR